MRGYVYVYIAQSLHACVYRAKSYIHAYIHTCIAGLWLRLVKIINVLSVIKMSGVFYQKMSGYRHNNYDFHKTFMIFTGIVFMSLVDIYD